MGLVGKKVCMHQHLTELVSSLHAVLHFDEVAPLHPGNGNPWHIPLVSAPRVNGNIQSEVEMLVLLWALVIMLKPKLVIETGTDAGVMTRALGCAVKANGFGCVLSAEVDASLAEQARAFCQGLPVQIITGPALNLPIEDADLLFLDSSYESRKQELAKICKPHAIAVLHDTVREPSMGEEAHKYSRSIHVVTPRGFAIIQPAHKGAIAECLA